jgi:hypothetical protein
MVMIQSWLDFYVCRPVQATSQGSALDKIQPRRSRRSDPTATTAGRSEAPSVEGPPMGPKGGRGDGTRRGASFLGGSGRASRVGGRLSPNPLANAPKSPLWINEALFWLTSAIFFFRLDLLGTPPSASVPSQDILFPPLISGRNPAECGHSWQIVRTTRTPR